MKRSASSMKRRIAAWRLYIAGSAHGFSYGHIAVYQTLLAKLDPSGEIKLPLTRDDWYAGIALALIDTGFQTGAKPTLSGKAGVNERENV